MAAKRSPLSVLILAAGRSTRMRSATTKLLHEVAGRPMVGWVAGAVLQLRADRRVVVLGNQADAVRECFPAGKFDFILQREQHGTGHAVMQARRQLGGRGGDVLILNGDLPAIRPETLKRLLAAHRRAGAGGSFLTAVLDEPFGYGRVVRDGAGNFLRVVEEKTARPAERRLREVNAGVYCFDAAALFKALPALSAADAHGEYRLPDVLPLLAARGRKVLALPHTDPSEVMGVNTRAELAEAGRRMNRLRLDALMESGVTVLDPGSVWIGPDVALGRDVTIHAGVHLRGRTEIGPGTTIFPGCWVADCRIGAGVTMLPYCAMAETVIGEGARVGPFCHLRPGTVLAAGVHVGNFVEVKKSVLGEGTKANHLTYLGDAVVGRGVNVGAGTITCNYDGARKHQTTIEDGAFIGSDTPLVAPVTVGRGAYVGTGATIRENVPAGSLAVTAGKQRNIEGWVERKKRER